MTDTASDNRRRELACMTYVVAGGLLLSLLFHLFKAFALGLNNYPHNTFLFIPADRFHDFTNIYKATRGLDPFASAVSVYPPFAYLVVYPFTLLGRDLALFALLAGYAGFMWRYVYSAVAGIAPEKRFVFAFVMAFLTYPFLFAVDRANIELLVFIALALFVRFHEERDDWKAMFCLACAMAMKMYPGALLLLFLPGKDYKKIFYTLLMAAGLTLAAMLVLKGGFAASLQGFLHNLAGFRQAYFLSDSGLQHNLSLFGALKLAYSALAPGHAFPETAYTAAMMALFAAVAVYVAAVERELWRAVAVIVLYFLVAPQVSFDYKLVHLLIPITLFLRRGGDPKDGLPYAAALALLCVPKDYFLIRGDISIAVLVNPLLCLGLIGALARQGLLEAKRAREEGAARA